MGGMIGQVLAIRHPERVRSLTSIMSTVGPTVGPPRPEAVEVLLAPPARSRGEYEQRIVDNWRIIGSPGFSFDEDRLRRLARRSWDAGYDGDGVVRQLLAILASGDRTEALRGIPVPTLVVHGEDDPLVQLAGGQATAEAVPDATLLTIPGMGHDLPRALWPTLLDALVEHTRRA